jgi:dTDP-4-dehydrorhamnose 3,5-epimerase
LSSSCREIDERQPKSLANSAVGRRRIRCIAASATIAFAFITRLPFAAAAVVTNERSFRMQVITTGIPEVKEIRPVRHHDPRGFFSEIFRESVLREHGVDAAFVQENHSLSMDRGVVRGLHFQLPPAGQAKLVRVTVGSIFDVAVDIRVGSPTYGRHVAIVLSAAEGNQFFVPEGFAHGFCTLEPNTEVVYKVTRYYSREHDSGLAWDDRDLAIAWPVSREEALLSDKDRRQPLLAELPALFRY